MVYSIQNGDIICSHANHRGDVIARSSDTGSLTYFALYEAYGTRPYEWDDGVTGDPDRQKANTKEEEKDLNLLNEGMRYRDLDTGTFLTRDPIGYADGPNVYCYVHCNPITHFDAWGLNGAATANPGAMIIPNTMGNSASSSASRALGNSLHTFGATVTLFLQALFVPTTAEAPSADYSVLNEYFEILREAEHQGVTLTQEQKERLYDTLFEIHYGTKGQSSSGAPKDSVDSQHDATKAQEKTGQKATEEAAKLNEQNSANAADSAVSSSSSENAEQSEAQAKEAAESDSSKQPKTKAKDRKKEEKRKEKEKKHGDPDWEEPASEDYAKWKAKELEKSQGKDARRLAHDRKNPGEGNRSKQRLDDDYSTE